VSLMPIFVLPIKLSTTGFSFGRIRFFGKIIARGPGKLIAAFLYIAVGFDGNEDSIIILSTGKLPVSQTIENLRFQLHLPRWCR
jgi:energy-converting hydrogenase Eha subunit F